MQAAVVTPPKVEESFTNIESVSLQFLPRQQEAPGWRLEEDPIVVPGERLTSYLDHEAATFARYEVIDLTAGSYASTKGNGFATLEIFRFPDFVKAFGAYSVHKDGALQYLNIANEAFVSKHSVHLWRGPFYIRVSGAAPDGNQSLVALATFVADRMPAAPAKPAVLNFLPANGRIPNSERYSADIGFGQPFLGNSFQAKFNVDGASVDEGLIIPAANPQQAARILEAYRALYIHNGKLLDPVPNLGEDNFTGEDKYLGRAVAFRIDRFVIAFNGFNERQKLVDLSAATAQRILGTIRKQLVTADKLAENPPKANQDQNVPAWAQPRP